jgi:hypothetical protein
MDRSDQFIGRRKAALIFYNKPEGLPEKGSL